MAKDKKPIFRYYCDDGRIEREVFPKGKFSFKHEPLDDFPFIYELKLNGDLIFADTKDKNQNLIKSYSRVKSYDDAELSYIDFYVDRLVSGSYTRYYTGKLDLRGSYNESAKTAKLKVEFSTDYKTLTEELDTEFNMFDLGLDIVNVNYFTTDYDNSVVLFDLINEIVVQILGTSFVSSLLSDTTNPVTGENVNPLKSLILAQKSDIINPTASDPATKGMLSLGKIMEWLSILFNGGFDVDSSGNLRFEHWNFYNNNYDYAAARTVGLDLTTYDNGKYIEQKNSFEYIEENIYRKERFESMESETPLFRNLDIDYEGKKTKNNTMVRSLNDVTLDIDYIQQFAEKISPEGFVIMATTFVSGIDYDLIYGDVVGEFQGVQRIKVIGTTSVLNTNNINQIAIIADSIATYIRMDNQVLNSSMKTGTQISLRFDSILVGSGKTATFELIEISTGYGKGSVTLSAGSYSNIDIGITTTEDAGACWLKIHYSGNLTVTISSMSVVRLNYKDLQNSNLIWQVLIDNYYIYGRPFLEGTINGAAKLFETRNFIKQGEIIKAVPLGKDYDFDANKLIKTDIGEGRLISATVNKDTMEYDLEIMY